MKKKVMAIIAMIIVVVLLIGTVVYGVIQKLTYKVNHPIATMTVEGYSEPIVIELYPEYAQNTVKNFIALSENGFYNGLTFHRIEEYIIQGGDPKGDGTGSPTLSAIDTSIAKDSDQDTEYTIPGEFKANGYENPLSHEVGVISMARSNYGVSELLEESYNSGGSQFFICTKYCPNFNGQYAAFGKVISGMETVEAISKVKLAVDKDEETGEETQTTKPEHDVKISSVTIEKNGVDYGKPETLPLFDYSSWYLQTYYGN